MDFVSLEEMKFRQDQLHNQNYSMTDLNKAAFFEKLNAYWLSKPHGVMKKKEKLWSLTSVVSFAQFLFFFFFLLQPVVEQKWGSSGKN